MGTNAARLISRRPPPAPDDRPALAGLFALLVHVLFLGLMVFAISWQTRPLPVVAEVWDALPGPETPPPPRVAKPSPPEPAPPEPVRAPPPVEVRKPVPTLPSPPKPQPPPKAPAREPARAEPKPDIALEKRKQEAKRQAEVDARHQRELADAQRREEEVRREVEAAKAAEQQRQREAEAARVAAQQAEQQRQREAEAARVTAQNAAAQQIRARAIDIYLSQIRAAVRSRVVEPPGIQGNPQAEVKVLQLPSGEVVSAKVTRSSGVPAYDEAVERAVLAASPLPLPADRSLFSRDLLLQFRLRE